MQYGVGIRFKWYKMISILQKKGRIFISILSSSSVLKCVKRAKTLWPRMFWRENRIRIRSYAVAVYNVHCKDKQKKVWWDNFVLQNNCWHSISLHNLIVGLWLGQPAKVKKGRILLTVEKMDGKQKKNRKTSQIVYKCSF